MRSGVVAAANIARKHLSLLENGSTHPHPCAPEILFHVSKPTPLHSLGRFRSDDVARVRPRQEQLPQEDRHPDAFWSSAGDDDDYFLCFFTVASTLRRVTTREKQDCDDVGNAAAAVCRIVAPQYSRLCETNVVKVVRYSACTHTLLERSRLFVERSVPRALSLGLNSSIRPAASKTTVTNSSDNYK